MFNITICDNEEYTCSNIENIVLDYARSKSLKVDIDIFYSGESLIEHLVKNINIDILFLAIELDQLSGIDVGKILRSNIKNETIQIIYISWKESYAMQLFRIRPLDFLIKPLHQQDIEKILDKAMSLLGIENHFFEYKRGRTYYKIPIGDIYYFKSEGKKIRIITHDSDRIIDFYGKMNQIEKQIPEKRFLLIHKSYLVQCDCISEYKYDFVKLINGETLAISQANRKKVRIKVIEQRRSENR